MGSRPNWYATCSLMHLHATILTYFIGAGDFFPDGAIPNWIRSVTDLQKYADSLKTLHRARYKPPLNHHRYATTNNKLNNNRAIDYAKMECKSAYKDFQQKCNNPLHLRSCWDQFQNIHDCIEKNEVCHHYIYTHKHHTTKGCGITKK